MAEPVEVTREHRAAVVEELWPGHQAPDYVLSWIESAGCLQVTLGSGKVVDLQALAEVEAVAAARRERREARRRAKAEP